MKNFEQRLERLEALGEQVRDSSIPLADALKAFEEGIRLAHSLEKDLQKVESRVEILMNLPQDSAEETPVLSLFDTEP